MQPRSDAIALASLRDRAARHARRFDADERRRLARFATVGLATTTIDIVLFTAMVAILGLRPEASNLFSYGTGVAASFALNRSWTFHDTRHSKSSRQLFRFLILQGASLFLSTALVFVLSIIAPAVIAKLISVMLVFIVNFSVSRSWVFVNEIDQKP